MQWANLVIVCGVKCKKMSYIIFILHIVILMGLLVCLVRMVKNIHYAIKKKNTPGIIYSIVLLFVGIIIFIYVLDYKRIWDTVGSFLGVS